jgi:glycosyltransferase involved in cell wall biosynthesis
MLNYLVKQGISVDCLCYNHPIDNSLCIEEYFFLKLRKVFFGKSLFHRLIRHLPSLILSFSYKLFPCANFMNDWHLNVFKYERRIRKKSYDWIVVEDLKLLPLAFRVRGTSQILFDAREYYTRQFEDHPLWKILELPYRNYLCQNYLNKCDHILTVSEGLKSEYNREYKINPIVVRSTPVSESVKVKKTALPIRLVHHGNANENRNLSKMVDVFSKLKDHFTFDFYLTGNQTEIQKLKCLTAKYPRIQILNPVSPELLIQTLNKYDIGFYYLLPNGFNLKHCLPNKFFDFIQARLPVAIGPSPEMKDLIRKYDCGFVAKEFSVESMAHTLNKLKISDIDIAKENSERASKKLCWEEEAQKLKAIFKPNSKF